MVSAEVVNQASPWIQARLETIHGSEAAALTEYVKALISNDMSLDRLAATCNDQLQDFLHADTAEFVQQLMKHLEGLVGGGNQPQIPSAPRSNFRGGKKETVGFPSGPGNGHAPYDPTSYPMPNLPIPQQSGIFMPPMPNFGMPMNMQYVSNGRGGRGNKNNARNGGRRGPKGRSEFSDTGQDTNYSKKRLIVENLPEDKLDKGILTDYFARFGTLVHVSLISERKMAELEYESHDQARAAWTSPEPIFNNRFIKVYWKKVKEGEEEPLDLEAFTRIQAERQKEHEEKEAKRKQHEDRIKQLMDAKVKVMQEQEALIEAAKASGQLDSDPELQEKLNSTTTQLQLQLAELQREAESLGITTGKPGSFAPTYRGGYRGGYRGRGGYSPYSRGRGRGRGGPFIPSSRTNLDLRPKDVKVELPGDKMDNFLAYIASSGQNVEDITKDDNSNIVTLSFPDRRSAEQFFHSPGEVPDVGEIKREWTKIDRRIESNTDESMIVES